MPFATGGNHGLRYVKEATFGVTPANPTMKELRHTEVAPFIRQHPTLL